MKGVANITLDKMILAYYNNFDCTRNRQTFGNLKKNAFHFHNKPWLYMSKEVCRMYIIIIKLIDIFPGKKK